MSKSFTRPRYHSVRSIYSGNGPSPRGKDILVFCDGTGKDGRAKSSGKEPPTNVWQLYKLAVEQETAISGGRQKEILYLSVIGSGLFKGPKNVLSQIFETTIVDNIITAYLHIAKHYEARDGIHLFGFSRGAFVARKVASLIYRIGIVRTEGELLKLWGQHERPVPWNLLSSRPRGSAIPIQSLVVWDTVGSIQTLPTQKQMELDILGMPDDELPPNVKHAFHMVAFHENRKLFRVTLFKPESPEDSDRLKEVWFPGSHSDVGGGTDKIELPNISLEWVLGELRATCSLTAPYVMVDFSTLDKMAPPDAYHESSPWKRMVDKCETRISLLKPTSLIHESVLCCFNPISTLVVPHMLTANDLMKINWDIKKYVVISRAFEVPKQESEFVGHAFTRKEHPFANRIPHYLPPVRHTIPSPPTPSRPTIRVRSTSTQSHAESYAAPPMRSTSSGPHGQVAADWVLIEPPRLRRRAISIAVPVESAGLPEPNERSLPDHLPILPAQDKDNSFTAVINPNGLLAPCPEDPLLGQTPFFKDVRPDEPRRSEQAEPQETHSNTQSGNLFAQVMFERLVEHGCTDLSSAVNHSQFSSCMIAGGSYGDIWKGKLHDGADIAIKVWRLNPITEDGEKSLKRATREIYNWSKTNHENIHKLLGVVMFQGRPGMVSKWMEDGNLREYLNRNKAADRYQLCVQVANGVRYLHSENIVHGDLKACNILVSREGVPKLADFDHSIMSDCSLMFSETIRIGGGTLRWMAPELCRDEPCQRNKQTDVYALGMTLLEIITGDVPYPRCGTEAVVFKILQRKLPDRTNHFSNDIDTRGDRMWALLLKCWDLDPTARPPAHGVFDSLQLLIYQSAPID